MNVVLIIILIAVVVLAAVFRGENIIGIGVRRETL